MMLLMKTKMMYYDDEYDNDDDDEDEYIDVDGHDNDDSFHMRSQIKQQCIK
jgi:uncharacterized protein YxjI